MEDGCPIELKDAYIEIMGEVGSPIAIDYLLNQFDEGNTSEHLTNALIKFGESVFPELAKRVYLEQDEKIKKLIEMVCTIGGKPVLKLIPLTYDKIYKPYYPEIISALQKLDDPEAKKIVNDYHRIIAQERGNQWRERASESKKKIFQ
jgi:hypothetical protein